MDLKHTKAMQAPVTEKPSQTSAPASSTGKLSLGSKNTWRAWYCEERVIHFYLNLGYRCLARRWKTPFAEIDLCLETPEKEILLVEVKSVRSLDYLDCRLTLRQKRRLQRAWLYCLERRPQVRLVLAVVSQQGEILILDDIFG